MPDTLTEYLDAIKELKAPRDAVFVVRAQTELLKLSDMLRLARATLIDFGCRDTLAALDRMAKEGGQ